MTTVKLDQKMRIRLPKHISKKLGLKGKELLSIEVKGNEIRLTKSQKINIDDDPVIKDMVERPFRTEIKITKELLDEWEDELWSGR